MNKRLYETRKSIMEQMMSDPNIDVSCKIIIEEVYKRYLDSDRLPKYFYSLVQIATLTIGAYIYPHGTAGTHTLCLVVMR